MGGREPGDHLIARWLPVTFPARERSVDERRHFTASHLGVSAVIEVPRRPPQQQASGHVGVIAARAVNPHPEACLQAPKRITLLPSEPQWAGNDAPSERGASRLSRVPYFAP